MSFRRSIRRWRYRHSEGSLALPSRLGRRGDELVGPVTSITPPRPVRAASERTGVRVGLRLSVTAFVVASLFTVLLVRLWSLQLVQGAQLNSEARADTTAVVTVTAPRGPILTRDGLVLAGDRPYPQIVLARAEAQQHPQVITRLAKLLGIKASTITAQLASISYANVAPVPLAVSPSQVTENDIIYIEQDPTSFPGVTITVGYERTYPQGDLATQAIGYIHAITSTQYAQLASKGYSVADVIGTTGLEQQYESYLRGKPGVDTFQINPAGVSVGELTATQPTPGDSLVLNMDGGLEQFLQNALGNQLTSLRSSVPAPWGAAVVMDVHTGAVLAMTSLPSYNDNDWVSLIGANGEPGISTSELAALNPPGCASGDTAVACPLLNYAIDGLQPPGSTFKLATATAAMDTGLINAGYYYDDATGTYTVGNTTFDDDDSVALGEVNVTSALTESDDVFFYNLGARFWVDGARYGKTPIQNTAEAYGLGNTSGIDLPDVPTGQIDSPALRQLEYKEAPAAFPNALPYTEGDNIEMAFGQGGTIVSPLELAEAYATFANHGTRYAPEMAAAIVNSKGKVVKTYAPKIEDHVSLPSSTWEPMDAGFEGVTQQPDGTGYAAFEGFDFSKYNVAGKTGTADTCPPTENCQPTSWFVSFGGPSNESPQYVVAVEIDQGGYGAEASAPVARQVWNYLESHPIPPVSLPKGN